MDTNSRKKELKAVKFSEALQIFLLQKEIEGTGEQTLLQYKDKLERFCCWLKDKDICSVSSRDVVEFMIYAKNNPKRESVKILSNQTLNGFHIALQSFFSWLEREGLGENVIKNIKPPKAKSRDILPYTEQELKLLLKAVKSKDMAGRRSQNVQRNETMIFVFLDTGMRVQEFCNLRIADYNAREGSIKIVSGKGNKDRTVYVGKNTQLMLFRYTQQQRKDTLPSDFLFVNRMGKRFKQSQIRDWLRHLGEKAEVKNVHPHRFRYTFAIEYLRNGGDIFTLQKLLGHSDLNMVRKYVKIAQVDIKAMHRIAGPVDRFFS